MITFEALSDEFESKNIPINRPGFYDHNNF
jgi:hypothetical protein